MIGLENFDQKRLQARALHRKCYGKDMESSRMSGRSTALALEYIAKCMRQPNVPHEVADHWHKVGMTRRDHIHLMHTIQNIVHDLGLEGFLFNKEKMSMMCRYHTWSIDGEAKIAKF